jgi:hypothetical protein
MDERIDGIRRRLDAGHGDNDDDELASALMKEEGKVCTYLHVPYTWCSSSYTFILCGDLHGVYRWRVYAFYVYVSFSCLW